MSWSDSNMAGDYWKWSIYLTIRKDGTYSVGAAQTCSDGPNYRLPSIYPLRKGRQVRDAIKEMFLDDNLSSEAIDWDEIISALSDHAPALAEEIKRTFAEDLILEREACEKAAELERRDKPINEWIRRAIWEKSDIRPSMASGYINYKKRARIFEFVQSYQSKYGVLPTGPHQLGEDLSVKFPKA